METVDEKMRDPIWLRDKLGISRNQVYQLVDLKLVPHHWIGTKIRFYPSEIDEWIKSGEAAKALNRPRKRRPKKKAMK